MNARIERALSQRIFLIERVDTHVFAVAGLTNNYRVTLSAENFRGHCCTCPDYVRRQDMCKHIAFVLFRVFKLNREAFLDNHDVLPDFAVEVKPDGPKRLEKEDEECCICYERFDETTNDTFSHCDTCGHRIHDQCWTVWMQHNPSALCPLCRSPIQQHTKKRHRVATED